MDILTQALNRHDGTSLPLHARLYKENNMLVDICKTRNSKLMFFKNTDESPHETTVKVFDDGTYETDNIEKANFRKEQTLM